MPGGQAPRVVVVTRSTDYQRLHQHHATAGQARFFLRQRSLATTEVEGRHGRVSGSMLAVEAAIPPEWRSNQVPAGAVPSGKIPGGEARLGAGLPGRRTEPAGAQ